MSCCMDGGVQSAIIRTIVPFLCTFERNALLKDR